MKTLKWLTIILGEQAIRLQATKMVGDQQVPTLIEYDPKTERVIQHVSDTEKTVVHLDKVLMYKYEEEKIQ